MVERSERSYCIGTRAKPINNSVGSRGAARCRPVLIGSVELIEIGSYRNVENVCDRCSSLATFDVIQAPGGVEANKGLTIDNNAAMRVPANGDKGLVGVHDAPVEISFGYDEFAVLETMLRFGNRGIDAHYKNPLSKEDRNADGSPWHA